MARKIVAPALALGWLALAGCNLGRFGVKDPATPPVFNENASRPGRVLEPKYCKIESAIVSRPVDDPMVATIPWAVADELPISLEAHAALEANGIRIGVITGSLPIELLEAFTARPPIPATEWVHIVLPEGEHTPIVVGSKTESVTLLLDHKGKVDGRDYLNAEGRMIVTPSHSGSKAVGLRIVPEVHHGDVKRTIAPLENAGPFARREFSIKDGQQEEILRDLAVSIDLEAGQTLVIGCRPQQTRSLGTFLFTQLEPTGDRTFQSILLVQAGRNRTGELPAAPAAQPDELPELSVQPIPVPSKDAKAP